jgi:N-dimethylarginine dimethylaminohydrolase
MRSTPATRRSSPTRARSCSARGRSFAAASRTRWGATSSAPACRSRRGSRRRRSPRLDERTLLVGLGYRTNEAGAEALRRALPGVDVLTFDLSHYRGPGEVLHLLSFISPLDADLALVYPPLAPARLLQLLAERGIRTVEVPEEEFGSLGCNVLALGPRVALALDGNLETRRRMERAGVDVRVYKGDELSRKGDGGATCLTRPLLRG